MDSGRVKILVSHRIDLESVLVSNEIYLPVRCGALYDKNSEKKTTIGDNTGEHISHKRESYCELTVQYWAWKNLDADYYGLCHYRRYLSFNPECRNQFDDWNTVVVPRMSREALQDHRLTDDKYIAETVSNYDLVTMVPVSLENVGRESVYEQYRVDGGKLHIEDLDLTLSIIEEKYPEYKKAAHDYLYGKHMYIGNIFIMKKELFSSYCEWLFDILDEFEKRADMSNYSVEAYRTPGHLGERLFGIYYTYLKQTKANLKSLELPLLFFMDTRLNEADEPTFSDDCIPIVMSSSESFAPICSTALQSIIDSSNPERNYDIVILQQSLSKASKSKMLKQIAGMDNFNVRFFDIKSFVSGYNLYESTTIPIETYFRLAIPEILPFYDKVIYLDCDLIVKRDLAQLFDTDIKEALIGACLDICEAGVQNGFRQEDMEYVKRNMRLKNPLMQINAGVLIMNTKKFREIFSTRYLFEFVEAGHFRYQDQDALNILCEDRIHLLDQRWNFAADPESSYRRYISSFAPRKLYALMENAEKDPWIIHYAGNEKPWKLPEHEFADEFWVTMQKTPFYSQFILRLTQDTTQQKVNEESFRLLSQYIGVRNTYHRIRDKLFPMESKRRALYDMIMTAFHKLIGK